MATLLTAQECDALLRYPRGRSMRLARSGWLPFVVLPDGEIRFDRGAVEAIVRGDGPEPSPQEGGDDER